MKEGPRWHDGNAGGDGTLYGYHNPTRTLTCPVGGQVYLFSHFRNDGQPIYRLETQNV